MEKLISKKQVREMVSYSFAHIDRLEERGEFPKRVKLGHRRAWVLSEIQDWIFLQIAKRDSTD